MVRQPPHAVHETALFVLRLVMVVAGGLGLHLGWLVVILVIALAPRAHAQSANASADALFKEGRDLVAAGKLAEGCAAFEASNKLDPAAGTLLNAADCREKNNQLATSWALFQEAARMTASSDDDVAKRRHQTALDRANALEPRLSKLTIEVDATAGVVVTRGDDVVDPGTWGHALPIDGGSYTITATAPGHQPWSTHVDVGPETDTKTVQVPALVASEVAAPVVTPSPRRSRTVPLVVGAGALVLGGAALGFELWGESIYRRAEQAPDHTVGDPLRDQANTRRYIAQGLVLGGAAAAGVALWLYLRHPAEAPLTATAKVHVDPLVGSAFGVQIGGAW